LQRLHGMSQLGLVVPRSPAQGLCHAGLRHPWRDRAWRP